jgi:hypothetical protein
MVAAIVAEALVIAIPTSESVATQNERREALRGEK